MGSGRCPLKKKSYKNLLRLWRNLITATVATSFLGVLSPMGFSQDSSSSSSVSNSSLLEKPKETDPDASDALPEESSPLTAMSLAREVIQGSESVHIYDWRKSLAEITLGYGYVDEANSFDSESYDLGLRFPQPSTFNIAMGMRRILIYSTPSTNGLGRTPYVQESTRSRLELYAGTTISLMEGRSIWRLGDWLGDVEQAVFGVASLHFAQEQANLNPLAPKKPKEKLGQKPVHSTFALELGLRMHVLTVFDMGFFFEGLTVRPLKGGEHLRSWALWTGGILWSIH